MGEVGVTPREALVVVAGHICLDIIPTFGDRGGGLAALLVPGSLVETGPAVLSTGGAVSNTGLALHRLGVPTRLMGKLGDDLFGHAVLRIVESYGPTLSNGMLVTAGAHTSYTVVISPPGVDRVFLHGPGANDTFGADDIPYDELGGTRLFHFGYPPLMRRMYAGGGAELEAIFRRVKQRGLVTSLDMSKPDPASEAGRADWRAILENVLPHVDVFLPSLEEILYMLDPGSTASARPPGPGDAGDLRSGIDGELLAEVADRLLAMNAAVVGLKLGGRGLYVRTTRDRQRLAVLCSLWCRSSTGESTGSIPVSQEQDLLETWLGRELLTPCFEVDVVGTTGAGDCTIAGFLAGMLYGLPPGETMTAAVAVGACNVEQADAVSGVPHWEAVQTRIRSGWRKRSLGQLWPGWTWDTTTTIALGPNDGAPGR
jgi:sugar/nucleoside kinase (ribokinase family)